MILSRPTFCGLVLVEVENGHVCGCFYISYCSFFVDLHVCVSFQGRRVDALATGADEGRGNLR